MDTSIQYIKGVGPQLAEVFYAHKIYTVYDLLHYYPKAYEERRAAKTIASLIPNQKVSLTVQIHSIIQKNRSYQIALSDSTGTISCHFFRIPYKGYFQQFKPQQEVRVNGTVTTYRNQLQFNHPTISPLKESEPFTDEIIPLYLDIGLSETKLKKIISATLKYVHEHSSEIKDPLPDHILKNYNLCSILPALTKIHKPPLEEFQKFISFNSPPQKRVIFEEFFYLQLHLCLRKQNLSQEKTISIQKNRPLYKEFVKTLPFTLTKDQVKSIGEIVEDMNREHPMHRLLQGDVGSGKTVVALFSMLAVAKQSQQVALMVPTEILARQHFENICKFLASFNVHIDLLVGSLSAKEKKKIQNKLFSGDTQICVGTHAMIQENVRFQNLSFVIIDEQHRFGVTQRDKLRQKGNNPHFLVMTATPIPRTLAMTVYGDLDISSLREKPPGRTPIITRSIYSNKRTAAYQFMVEQVQKGRQAYIVFPIIEESEELSLTGVEKAYEELKTKLPSTLRIDVLHGQMKPHEKEVVMNQFKKKQLDIMITTTVVEVGVDVPNANIMIIEHAERFGLSQLHQLRGRVGRGSHQSYCVLISSYQSSSNSSKRGTIMEQTDDGFLIAEEDLQLRGPGDLGGSRQTGVPEFKMANLFRDANILMDAKKAAVEVVKKNPHLLEHALLKKMLQIKRQWFIG